MTRVFRISIWFIISGVFVQLAYSFQPPLSSQCYSKSLTMSSSASSSDNQLPVMVNGLPGLMALETAMSCLDHGLKLLPYAFTGDKIPITSMEVQGKEKSVNVELIKGPGIPGSNAKEVLKSLKDQYPNLVVIDYTHPSAVLNNVDCYVANNCDFVMGTTGGDPIKVQEIFNKGINRAVIAPNMAKQIVALQAALLDMSNKYPKSFKNYKLTVTESHQSTKADTSGTAKALVAYLSTLTGAEYSFEEIVKLRDRDSQLHFGVPEHSLDGHAFHTYRLTSADESVAFELKHNVCGRRVYADGTVEGVLFIHKLRTDPLYIKTYQQKRLFNMIDVLESERII